MKVFGRYKITTKNVFKGWNKVEITDLIGTVILDYDLNDIWDFETGPHAVQLSLSY